MASRWITRPAELSDAAAIARLVNERWRQIVGEDQTTEERVRTWMTKPETDLGRDGRALADSTGRVVGWADVEDPGEPYVNVMGSLDVAPSASRDPQAWDLLFAWIVARAAAFVDKAPAEARVVLAVYAFENDEAKRCALERHGAKPARTMRRLRIDFPPPPPPLRWPNGVDRRTFDPREDLPALAEASLEVFRDHWGFVARPLEEEIREQREWIEWQGDAFDASLCHLAVAEGSIAGFALCRPHIPLDRTRGVVGSLGVRPAWRGRGLGSALLARALHEFYERGCASAEVLVDSENLTGAVRLYERAGMRTIRTQLVYEKELRPGTDLSKR
ncbi:MAG: GNAT family N-acetyltransferase [Thermotogota bacterium]